MGIPVKLFATCKRQIAATLHFKAVNNIRLQIANHSGQAGRLLKKIESLESVNCSCSSATQGPDQTRLSNCRWHLRRRLSHLVVVGQILQFGMHAIVGTVRKHVDVPSLILQLLDPTCCVNAFPKCDKEYSHFQLTPGTDKQVLVKLNPAVWWSIRLVQQVDPGSVGGD